MQTRARLRHKSTGSNPFSSFVQAFLGGEYEFKQADGTQAFDQLVVCNTLMRAFAIPTVPSRI